MKRLLLITAAFLALSARGWSQEPAHEPAATEHSATAEHGETAAHEEGDKYEAWKWANFAILAVVLGYMLGKALPPFFAGRTSAIQKGLAEAARLKSEADLRAAQIEHRMASLQSEIDDIRSSAHAEMARESERLKQATVQSMTRLQAQAEQEIEAITKQATEALKTHSAQLALELAEQRVKARIDGGTQSALVNRFVSDLAKPQTGARI